MAALALGLCVRRSPADARGGDHRLLRGDVVRHGDLRRGAMGRSRRGVLRLLQPVSRLSLVERRDDRVGLRPPLAGLSQLDRPPGTVALVGVMIGSVSFDGLSAGPGWQDFSRPIVDNLTDAGLSPRSALELTYSVALVVVVGLVIAFYRLGIAGARSVDSRKARRSRASLRPLPRADRSRLRRRALREPPGLQRPGLPALLSDPLGRGSDLLGTADWSVDYGAVGAETFWYLQVGFVVAGHLAALALAHDRALVVYDEARLATRSQYWMLGVIVGSRPWRYGCSRRRARDDLGGCPCRPLGRSAHLPRPAGQPRRWWRRSAPPTSPPWTRLPQRSPSAPAGSRKREPRYCRRACSDAEAAARRRSSTA